MRTLMRVMVMRANKMAALEAILWSRPLPVRQVRKATLTKSKSRSITNDSNLFKMKFNIS